MIYSFLPDNYKKALKKEYRSRVLIVLFCALSAAAFIGDIALIPSLLMSQSKNSELTLALSNLIKKNASEGPTPQEQVTQANTLLKYIPTKTTSPADFVIQVASLKNPGIKISQFEVADTVEGITPVTATGIALTRDSLLAWKKALENHPEITKVDLPVSDLAKSKDISFIVKISIKHE